jgi:hypothetical protein
VWQRSNKTGFLFNDEFYFFLQNKVIRLIVSLGSYTAMEALLEGFCWNTFQLVSYALLDIIPSTKMEPFLKWFLSQGNKKK